MNKAQLIVDILCPPNTLDDGSIIKTDLFTIDILKNHYKSYISEYRFE